jgi:hypothetical protein
MQVAIVSELADNGEVMVPKAEPSFLLLVHGSSAGMQ